MRRSAIFSATLERRQRINRFALLVAATLLVAGSGLIAIWALRALEMLAAVEAADRTPIVYGVLIALAGLGALCLIVYVAIRTYGSVTSR